MAAVHRVLVALAAVLFTSGASADWISQSNANALQVLRAQAVFQPESAADQGLAEFDGEIVDLKAGYQSRATASDREQLVVLEQRLAREQDPRVRQDLAILIQYLQDEIESRRIEEEYLLPYLNLPGMLFSSFRSLLDPRVDKARHASALQRLRKYTGTEPGYQPIAALARARSAERFDVSGLQAPYRAEVETDLADTPQYVAGIRELFEQSGLTGWEDDLALLETQLAEYATWVSADLLPRASADHRLPPAVYANNLKDFGVREDPDWLIREGQYGYQLIRTEMKTLARKIAEQRGWKERDLGAVIRRLKLEVIPEDKLLETYRQRLSTIEDIIRREAIVSLPERAAAIRLATEAESAASPASYMSPPQLINNTGQYGEFVLVQRNPALGSDAVMDDWNHDSITWALIAHEARPGHEMQFSSMIENGTSLARVLFAFNSANAEGWGLYAEAIVQEYVPEDAQLFFQYTRLMRAARMFLDPMVNTGLITPAQARDFLVKELALSPAMATSEADRYAFRAPGQATSYYYGFINLMRLRTELEVALGDAFEQRTFHDFILEQGLLPPALLRQAVLEKFAPVEPPSRDS